MAQNCNNVVTPKMIRNGQMQIGDSIQLDDFLSDGSDIDTILNVADTPLHQTMRHDTQQRSVQQQQSNTQSHQRNMSPQRSSSNQPSSRNSNNFHVPLCYEEITPYMNQVTLDQIEENLALNIPQTPLSTEMFNEALDVTDVQQFTGFLRTQIGRYMRIEQLIGSDTIRDRYGYLVGVGLNFIILQEVLTGNIMIIDLFSIRLTYIYYSDAAVV